MRAPPRLTATVATVALWLGGVLAGVAATACSSGAIARAGHDGGLPPVDDAALAAGGDATATVCTPGGPPSCDGAAVRVCRSDGSGYDYTPCPAACQAGACTCTVGTLTCQAQTVLRCDADGTFHTDHVCGSDTPCQGGVCGDARCQDEISSTNPHGLPTNAWPRFRHDNRNTGATPSMVADAPHLKWKLFIGGTRFLNGTMGGLASGPVVNQGNVVFIGGGDADGKNGALYALDGNALGKTLWVFAGNRGYGYTTPAVRLDGTSYFSAQDGNAYAVDPQGKLAWKFPFGMQDDSDPIVTQDGNVIYGSDTHELFALDAAGKLVWKSDPATGPGEVDAALAESCSGQILAGGSNGWSALDAKSGKTLWRVAAGGPVSALMSSPMVTADGVMYGADSGGALWAIDATGQVMWKTQAGPGGAGTSVAKVGKQVFAVLDDGALHAFDAHTGAPGWIRPLGQPTETYKHGGPVVDGKQRLYVNSSNGFVYAFDTAGTQLWKLAASGVASAGGNSFGTMAIGNDGTLYVPGNDGNLYAFQ